MNNILQSLIKLANDLDKKGKTNEANEIDSFVSQLNSLPKNLCAKCKSKKIDKLMEDYNIDNIVRSNGLDGISAIDNQNCGAFQGLSDAYFYTQYGNYEGPYGDTER